MGADVVPAAVSSMSWRARRWTFQDESEIDMRTLSSAEAATVGGGTGDFGEAAAAAIASAVGIANLRRALHDAEEARAVCEESWCGAVTLRSLGEVFLA